jgi:hypothetical protein
MNSSSRHLRTAPNSMPTWKCEKRELGLLWTFVCTLGLILIHRFADWGDETERFAPSLSQRFNYLPFKSFRRSCSSASSSFPSSPKTLVVFTEKLNQQLNGINKLSEHKRLPPTIVVASMLRHVIFENNFCQVKFQFKM